MTTDFDVFLSDIQNITHESVCGLTLFANTEAKAKCIQNELLKSYQIHSVIEDVTEHYENKYHKKTEYHTYYIIPFEDLADKKLDELFIKFHYQWDKDQNFVQYTITFYNFEATFDMYNMLVVWGYHVKLLPNNLQLIINCLDNSVRKNEIQNLSDNLLSLEKSSPQSVDFYFNKILFRGKIKNEEYCKIRKQEFPDTKTIEQDKDIIIRSILYQYFNNKIRKYFMLKTFPKKFDANNLDSKTKDNINLIRDFLYSVAEKYINTQIQTANKTEHKPIIRFDYLKTSNEYNDFKRVLTLAQEWVKEQAEKQKQRTRYLKQANLGAYKIMDLFDGYHVVQLFSPGSLDFEGGCLHHCVGDGYYDNEVHKENVAIYSIRDANGVSQLTIQVVDNKIIQCQGKSHTNPTPLLRKLVHDFMKKNHLDIPDINGWNEYIAYIKQDGKLYDVFNLPKGFVVKGNIDLCGMGLDKLPDMSTVTVLGNFWCATNNLHDLSGAPKKVGKECRVGGNPLNSLYGMPLDIGGEISLYSTNLTQKSFVPIHMIKYMNKIRGIDSNIKNAWVEQIQQRQTGLRNIVLSLSSQNTQ